MAEKNITLKNYNNGTKQWDALYPKTKMENVEGLAEQLAQKATKAELNSLGQLKLSGTYATLTDLQTAYPSGDEGLYLVTADGYVYRWDDTSWVQTVKFQSDGIATGTVDLTKLNDNVLENIGLNVYKGGFEVGTISSDGTLALHYGRYRSKDFINTIDKTFHFQNPVGYEHMLFSYDENENFVERVGWFTDSEITLSGFKYKVLFRRLDNETLTDEDMDYLSKNVVIKTENSILKKLESVDESESTIIHTSILKPSVKSISHQGFTDGGKYPMQTIPAFKEAGRRGYDGLEVDVRWTLDNIPILWHDRDIVALDGTVIPIPETNYDVIMQYQIFEDSTITLPTFYDYMKICKLYGLIPYIELKGWGTTQQITDIANYVKKMKFDKVIWSSNNVYNLQNILAEDENASIAFQAISTQYDTAYYTDPEGEGRWLYDRLLQNPSAETIFRIRESVVTESLINDFLELGFKVTLGTIDEKHYFEDYAHLCSYTMSNIYKVTDALVL